MTITVIGRLHFTVTSESSRRRDVRGRFLPRDKYIVDLEPQKDAGPDPRKAYCSCPAFHFNPSKYCKHCAAVVEFIQSNPL